MLDLIRHSRSLAQIRKKTVRPLSERLMLYFSQVRAADEDRAAQRVEDLARRGCWPWHCWPAWDTGSFASAMILAGLQKAELQEAGIGLGATFLRVNLRC